MSKYELAETYLKCPSCYASTIRTELWSHNDSTVVTVATFVAYHRDCDCGHIEVHGMGQYLERKDAGSPCEMWSEDNKSGTLKELASEQLNFATALLSIKGASTDKLESFCRYAERRLKP